MTWDYPTPFTHSVTVLPAHIDALDHTNNTQYVNWCNEAAWAHTTALGLGAKAYKALDRAMALTNAEYQYLQATRLGEQLEVGTWITTWERRMLMERRMQIKSMLTGETVLRARLQFVCIEISSGKPKRPPKAFIDGYTPALIG
jgi:acyl-CoA thioester hydrolase